MKLLALFSTLAIVCACGKRTTSLKAEDLICGPYPISKDSPYILPYPPGESYKVNQGNCSGDSHRGSGRYAYDFDMGYGEIITAARSGKVIKVVEQYADGNGCPNENYILIRHSDGTMAQYAHLTQKGSLVDVGNNVAQGEQIGRVGNTGCSTDYHLHFNVFRDESLSTGMAVSFKNINSSEPRLQANQSYQALP